MLVSFVHSIKLCFVVYWFPHGDFGESSSFKLKEWVNLVCPMSSRARGVSSLLVFLGCSFLSFKMGYTQKSLLWEFFLCLVPFLCNYLPDFRFEVNIRYFCFLSGTILRVALINESVLLYRWIPIWLRIQQNITFLLWFIELSLFRSLTMTGFSSFVFLRDCRTWNIESEWIINFSLLCVETSLSAKFIAQILAEIFFQNFLENFSTSGFIVAFGAICENV